MIDSEHTIYADASPLIALARIDRLDILHALSLPVYTTAAVWQEVVADPSRPGQSALDVARTTGLLTVVSEQNSSLWPPLGLGEATTLSAASKARAAVLLDDRQARRLLQRDPMLAATIPSMIGTVGAVVLAQQRGLIRQVSPILDALRQSGLRMSQRLYEDALRRAGEWPP